MRFDRLDLNLLVALSSLIEHRSVSAAAKQLNLSQPAVSGALNRLRDYFGDDLLVQSGRHMMLTPKAEELAQPVRDALLLIRSRITTPAVFDPATSDRNFVIIGSDYVFTVLLSRVLAKARLLAPGLTFEIMATDRLSNDRIAKGEADLAIILEQYIQPDLPRCKMFRDQHAVICWKDGPHAAGISSEDFFSAGHAVAYFGSDRFPALSETIFERQGALRRTEVRLPNHGALPEAIIGTSRLATMNRRHALHYAQLYPIAVLPIPVEMPAIVEVAQWHTMRSSDHGLRWLIELCVAAANEMSPS